MNEEMKRLHRVCFTGHRPEKLILTETNIKKVEKQIKELLQPAVTKAISDGYTTFITGMARGFDMWAADIVLKEREYNQKIHLICALPIDNFEKSWSLDEQMHYKDILNKADYIKVVSKHYSQSCFQTRNMYMVDYSAKVIAGYNGTPGGTRNTIAYAKRKNIEVENILKLC